MTTNVFRFAVAALICLPLSVQSQGFSYAGLRWDMGSEEVKTELGKKGFHLTKVDDGDFHFEGKVSNWDGGLWAYMYKGKLSKVTVTMFTPDHKARSVYADMKESLTSKYGSPSNSLERFIAPYYDGDGYEEQAIRLEKATFLTIWDAKSSGDEQTLGLEITPALSVRVSYEGPTWTESLAERRKRSAKDF